jgi:hypothetical protein
VQGIKTFARLLSKRECEALDVEDEVRLGQDLRETPPKPQNPSADESLSTLTPFKYRTVKNGSEGKNGDHGRLRFQDLYLCLGRSETGPVASSARKRNNEDSFPLHDPDDSAVGRFCTDRWAVRCCRMQSRLGKGAGVPCKIAASLEIEFLERRSRGCGDEDRPGRLSMLFCMSNPSSPPVIGTRLLLAGGATLGLMRFSKLGRSAIDTFFASTLCIGQLASLPQSTPRLLRLASCINQLRGDMRRMLTPASDTSFFLRMQCEVVGSWNEWAERIPMTKITGTTVYEATILMVPGKHVFKFVKDGVTWECSPDIQQEVGVMMMPLQRALRHVSALGQHSFQPIPYAMHA